MRYLLAFLYRKRILILFIALQAVALILTFRSRSFQRASLLNSSSALTGNILEKYDHYTRYLDLDKQNQRLARENARLRGLLKGMYLPITQNTTEKTDTVYASQYQFITANVINSSFRKTRNYITLDRGRLHGVEKEMGVIGPRGVVGIVQSVSSHYATVLPLIHPGIAISGQLKDQGFFGPVNWNSKDYRYTHLSDIPRYAVIEKGDSVVTDTRSLTFPPGILIGKVQEVNLQQDQNFYNVGLELATDFSSIRQVYVVTHKMKWERTQLESNNINGNP